MTSDIKKTEKEKWKPKTKLEKILIVLTIIALLMIVFLIIGLIILSKKSNKSVCETNECVKTASMYLNNLDESTDPCSDFYNYSCGNFHKHAPLLDESRVSNFGTDLQRTGNQIKEILMRPKSEDDPEYYKKMKDFFASCMNTTKLNEVGIEPIKELLNELGGWPVIEGSDWDENNFDLTTTLINLYQNGINPNPILVIYVTEDEKHPTNNILVIRSGYNRKLNIKDLVKIAVHFGANQKNAEREMEQIRVLAEEIYEMELDLSAEAERLTVAEFENFLPKIDVKKLLNKIGLRKSIFSQDIILAEVEFFRNLSTTLEKVNKRVIWNYIMWQVVENLLEVADVYSNSLISANWLFQERYQHCSNLVLLPLRLGSFAMYMREIFNKDKKPMAEELIKNFRNAFISLIERSKQMDENLKKITKEFISSFGERVAFPDDLDDAKIDNYYKSLSISEDDLFSNYINSILFNQRKEFANLNKNRVHSESLRDLEENLNLENEKVFPAVLLTDFMFAQDKPNFANYGSFAAVLRLYSPQIIRHLTKKDAGFKDLFICNEEEIDSIFITLVQSAYKAWEARNEQEITLPGLSLNDKQMFWLQYANILCASSKTNDEYEKRMVNHALSNIKEFSKAFKCPTGSGMNPPLKCSI